MKWNYVLALVMAGIAIVALILVVRDWRR